MIFSVIATLTLTSACSSHNESPFEPLHVSLIKQVEKGELADQLSSLYILSDLQLTSESITEIESLCQQKTETHTKLLCAYFLYKKLQTQQAASNYVELFPKDIQGLNQLFNQATNHVMPISLADLLIQLAQIDEAAQTKLQQAASQADGWLADALQVPSN